jgi:hypothetical protein
MIRDAAVALAIKTLTGQRASKQALLSTHFDTSNYDDDQTVTCLPFVLLLVVGMEYGRLNRIKPSGGEAGFRFSASFVRCAASSG